MATTMESHDGSSGDPAFRVEAARHRLHPRDRALGDAAQHRRDVGRFSDQRRILHLRRPAHGLRLQLSTRPSASSSSATSRSFLLGLASLQGPEAGTTAFAISRAAFGTSGSRIISFFNWITQLGFETEGLILIVGAAIVLCADGRRAPSRRRSRSSSSSSPRDSGGHAVLRPRDDGEGAARAHRPLRRDLRAARASTTSSTARRASRDSVEAGSSTPRDSPSPSRSRVLAGPSAATTTRATCPVTSKKGSIVGWIFVGTALPEIAMMVLGAATYTFLSSSAQSTAWNGANPFEALHIQHTIPSWVVVLFLIFAIVQLFGINSLDLYSSGVSLQAMGLRLKRYQAVVLDSILACGLTLYAVFQSTFSLYMKEFVGRHHRLDRAVVRDHDGRLDHAPIPLQRRRTAATRQGQHLLRRLKRHELERHRRRSSPDWSVRRSPSPRRRRRSTSPSTG